MKQLKTNPEEILFYKRPHWNQFIRLRATMPQTDRHTLAPNIWHLLRRGENTTVNNSVALNLSGGTYLSDYLLEFVGCCGRLMFALL